MLLQQCYRYWYCSSVLNVLLELNYTVLRLLLRSVSAGVLHESMYAVFGATPRALAYGSTLTTVSNGHQLL
jgi:hypothetical protein